MWRINAGDGTEAQFQAGGKILKKDTRHVVISDMSIDDAKTVAIKTRKDLTDKDSTIQNIVSRFGYDLHFPPGEADIVGLKKAKDALSPPKERDITKAATLLANTMYKARNQEGVVWFSDWGGSAILTRAMQILHHENGIQLDKHSVFLNRPTSNLKEAFKIAKNLGLVNGDNLGLEQAAL